MTTDVRVLRQAEWDKWYEQPDPRLRRGPGVVRGARTVERAHEYDRSLGVWDGDECVGTAGAFSFRVDGPRRRLGAGRRASRW